MKKLLVVNGHPDPRPERYCHALAAAYAAGALRGGWQVRRLDLGRLPNAMLNSFHRGFFDDPAAPELLSDFDWAGRLAIVYPLWFDRPPEGLCAVFSYLRSVQWGPADGRKAQVIVTMDMPAFAARSLVKPGIEAPPMLSIPGLLPEEPLLIGCVSTITAGQRGDWLKTVEDYGERSSCGSAIAPSRMEAFAAMIDRTVAQWRA